jgi:ribose transport system substrate-binding protein
MTIKRIALAASVVLALGVTACGGSDSSDDEGSASVAAETTAATTGGSGGDGGGSGGTVKIAFSAPAADHGWMAAITRNARAEAEALGDVDFQLAEGATDSAGQADQIETLINGRPDALVILPNEGDALTPVAQRATAAGIPVINVDREFDSENAFRTFIGGDNYGIGWQAGNYFADELRCDGNVVEIQGIAGISVTELRTQGFADAIRQRCRDGIRIVAQQPADFLPDRGLAVMETILQAQDDIDAVYTHDDDMAEGVVAAIENANRQDEMFLTGAGGSRAAMERIKEGGLYRATFLYNPSMSASAVRLARLIARDEGLQDLVEPEVPSRIQVPATAVTRENVDQLMELGF